MSAWTPPPPGRTSIPPGREKGIYRPNHPAGLPGVEPADHGLGPSATSSGVSVDSRTAARASRERGEKSHGSPSGCPAAHAANAADCRSSQASSLAEGAGGGYGSTTGVRCLAGSHCGSAARRAATAPARASYSRSEEHTSELQSQSNLVCRLLLEKKKKHL